MPTVNECHKAIGMTLIDWFATFAPEPNDKEMHNERMKDLNELSHNDKFVLRSEIQIWCELRYQYARAMMRARQI